MELALMLEGQNGLNWQRWQRMVRAAEDLGFAGLYRSDHFTNGSPPDIDSLELWVSLTWLAANTERIEFGPLVTPVSFRHPVFTARMAKDVDNLSVGRLRLGLGAGWQVREHEMFGFDLLPVRERFARFEEGLEVITSLLNSPERSYFDGTYYHLRDAVLMPPERPSSPPIVIGGNGPALTLPLVVRFADEWNAVLIPPEEFRRLSHVLDGMLEEQGRPPSSIRRTLMQNLRYARNDAELRQQTAGRDEQKLREGGVILGQASEVVDQLGRYAEAGVQRIMLQWLDLDAIDRLEDFAARVMPQIP